MPLLTALLSSVVEVDSMGRRAVADVLLTCGSYREPMGGEHLAM